MKTWPTPRPNPRPTILLQRCRASIKPAAGWRGSLGPSRAYLTKPYRLLPCHRGPTFRTFALKARAPRRVREPFTATRANAISARACCTATPLAAATAAALPRAPACAGAFTSWACSVSSWHNFHLLGRSWYYEHMLITNLVTHALLVKGYSARMRAPWVRPFRFVVSCFSACCSKTILCGRRQSGRTG